MPAFEGDVKNGGCKTKKEKTYPQGTCTAFEEET